VWHVEDALLLASHPCFGVNLSIIGIAEVDAPTAFLGNAGGQCDRDTRRFDTGCGIVGTRSLDVRAMGQNAARHVFKTIPLLDEIIPDMVADLVNQFAVRVGDLGDMRRIDDDLAAIGDRAGQVGHDPAPVMDQQPPRGQRPRQPFGQAGAVRQRPQQRRQRRGAGAGGRAQAAKAKEILDRLQRRVVIGGGARVGVVAASRELLNAAGELTFTVPPLSLPDELAAGASVVAARLGQPLSRNPAIPQSRKGTASLGDRFAGGPLHWGAASLGLPVREAVQIAAVQLFVERAWGAPFS